MVKLSIIIPCFNEERTIKVLLEKVIENLNQNINGIPTIKDRLIDSEVMAWEVKTQLFYLNPPGEAGKDCLKLNFSINSDSYLEVKGIDLRTGIHLNTKILGLIN